jgi:hypothetical protein
LRVLHPFFRRHRRESFPQKICENEHAAEWNVPRGEEEATVHISHAGWMIFPCSFTRGRCRNQRGEESTCCDSADDSLTWPRGCSKEVIARKRLERSQNRDGVLVDMRELAAKMTKFSADEERFVSPMIVANYSNKALTDAFHFSTAL